MDLFIKILKQVKELTIVIIIAITVQLIVMLKDMLQLVLYVQVLLIFNT